MLPTSPGLVIIGGVRIPAMYTTLTILIINLKMNQ